MSIPYEAPSPQPDMVSNWGPRLVAAIIDSIPWIIIGYIISWVAFFGAPYGSGTWQFMAGAGGWLVWLFVWPLFYGIPLLVYCYVFEMSASAATPGKRIMHLKVESANEGKANSGQVLKRNLSKILWIIFLIDILLGVLTKGPDPRQRYFDRFAGTTVVQTQPGFGSSTPPPPPPPPPPA